MDNSISGKIKEFIPESISADQAKDTGMAMVLICLLTAFFGQKQQLFVVAILLLLVNMIWPGFYKPIAKIWLGLSHLLGTIVSKVILSVIFFGLVMPVGLARRILGKDSLQVKKWKKGRGSVFKARDHEFTSEDISHPY
jgi:hypothetical protein